MKGFRKLDQEVISVGLCTDCGNCAGICPNRCLAMNYETELPELMSECRPECDLCFESCPGKDIPMLDMDEMLFRRQRGGGEELYLGIGQKYLKGHAVDAAIRDAGGGGGLVTALLVYALENNLIDAAIVAVMSKERPWRVVPGIAATRDEVVAAAQAKAMLVPMNSLLSETVEKGFRRVGVVALPCQVHAIRKMQLHGRPREILDSIEVVIGLFCGGNQTWRGTEHTIVEQADTPLDQVAKLEYRAGKYPGSFTVTTKDGAKVVVPMRKQRGMLANYTKDRCRMCYDYANELADVSVGEYWGVEMAKGSPGMSSAIVRTDKGKKLVEGAQVSDYVSVDTIAKDNFFQGLYELKKHGGANHIIERKRYGWATPDYHLPLDVTVMPRKINQLHPQLSG